jgi:tRNA threonylcarbamoyladenosine biosynthesis protein TsaE
MLMMTWNTLEDCHSFARMLARVLETPVTIRLDGTLGAGKTQFTKFLAQSLGADSTDVTSPTFVLIHRYETSPVMYHLDAYRVGDEDEFLELGVEELFEEPAITVIEWGEKFVRVLPQDHLAIEIEVESEHARTVQVTGTGIRSAAIIAKLHAGRS